jgi:NADPH:quinone reductase-like Zn-dependent oxidoreductase
MRAIVQDSYGPAERWRLAEIAEPEIADSEVLVKVHTAGIDRGTWHAMTGLPYLGRLYFGLRKPKRPVPGLDVAGTVAAIGADVTRFAVGDEVFGIGKGSFAEHVSAREDKLVPKPANITFEQAAVLAISGLTALQSLRDAGRVKAGQHVLIIGASGGVGTFAVQIAKTFGAEVTGVCSTTKTNLVTSIGADHVIDYTQDDFADGPQRYDLILDIGGNSSVTRLRRALTPRRTLVIVGGEDHGRWTGLSRNYAHLRCHRSCVSGSPSGSPKKPTPTSNSSPSSAKPVNSRLSSTRPSRSRTPQTPCDTSKPDGPAERSPSQSDLRPGPPLDDVGVQLAEQSRRTRTRDNAIDLARRAIQNDPRR